MVRQPVELAARPGAVLDQVGEARQLVLAAQLPGVFPRSSITPSAISAAATSWP